MYVYTTASQFCDGSKKCAACEKGNQIIKKTRNIIFVGIFYCFIILNIMA